MSVAIAQAPSLPNLSQAIERAFVPVTEALEDGLVWDGIHSSVCRGKPFGLTAQRGDVALASANAVEGHPAFKRFSALLEPHGIKPVSVSVKHQAQWAPRIIMTLEAI